MIELFVIKETEWLELVTESVSLEGQRYQAPRSITAKIITKQGTHSYYSVSEGDTVLFKWKGKELFRGIVFSRNPEEHWMTLRLMICCNIWSRTKMFMFSQINVQTRL